MVKEPLLHPAKQQGDQQILSAQEALQTHGGQGLTPQPKGDGTGHGR